MIQGLEDLYMGISLLILSFFIDLLDKKVEKPGQGEGVGDLLQKMGKLD